jgi:hypothetical protein
MEALIGKRFPLLASLLTSSIAICAAFLLIVGLPAGAEDVSLGSRVTDRGGAASFVPPEGWVRWDFWGAAAFSPTADHNPRITFTVRPEGEPAEGRTDTAMKDYVRTFSTENYTLLEKENLYLGGWWGVRVLAGGTEKNVLFGNDYVWIQEYFTDNSRISLVFRSDPASFETYRDTVLASFRSLIIYRNHDGLR